VAETNKILAAGIENVPNKTVDVEVKPVILW
jgi:hypothetical protein